MLWNGRVSGILLDGDLGGKAFERGPKPREEGAGPIAASALAASILMYLPRAAYAGWRLGLSSWTPGVTGDDHGTPARQTLVNEAYAGWGTRTSSVSGSVRISKEGLLNRRRSPGGRDLGWGHAQPNSHPPCWVMTHSSVVRATPTLPVAGSRLVLVWIITLDKICYQE
jgi:hypothetical protein